MKYPVGSTYLRASNRKYGSDSYPTISQRISRLEPFAGNSMHGGQEKLREGAYVYVIYSYSTTIAIYDPADRTFYENVQRYSITTSKHQSEARALMFRATYHVECDGDYETARAAVNLSPQPA